MKSRSLRLPTISDTPDDWVDESWTVDCVCGVNFDDGEEMVNCDECGVWVHTRCSKYVKSEKLFACDKCKYKKLRKETEESEVAQLLVELPTKTLRMDNPNSVSFSSQNHFQVCSDIPLEDKVHVQGIPGGDPSLFRGMSSVFSQTLWKCTGYVPKKFNHQYREFPCWDERKDDDDDKLKEEIERRANNGADALFSLSKENGSIKTSGGVLDMGPPTTDKKTQEVVNNEGRQQQSGPRKEKNLIKPIVIYGNRKKNDSKMPKDQNRKKSLKANEKDCDSKRRDLHSSESVSINAKQSESNEGKGPMVFNTDKQRDVQANPKLGDCPEDNNNPLKNLPLNDSRLNPLEEEKQIEENEGNQVPPSGEIFSKTKDGMASPLIHIPMETVTMKHPDARDDVNNNRRIYSRSNGIRSNTNNLGKANPLPKVELHAPAEVKSVEINHSGKTSSSQKSPTTDLKLDSSKKEDDPLSTSSKWKNEAVSVSEKVQNVDKIQPHVDSKVDEPDESTCRPSQPKGQMKGSESSTRSTSELKHDSGTLEGQSKLHGTVTSPSSGGPNQHKVANRNESLTVAKSSVRKSSSKPSVHDKARYSYTDDRNSSGKQKGVCDYNNYGKSKKDNVSTELLKNRKNISENPKKLVKDIPKSSSTSVLKSSHLSKTSHAPVSNKNSSELKLPANLSSSGDTANSSRSESSGAHERNKSTSEVSVRGEKTSQLNRHPAAPKNHPPHVHPPISSSTPATNLSDEELALLLHQELNSSPRVPRVPRMRHAGSLPQLASTTSTSTLMKRTSSSRAKDKIVLAVSRKKNKELANNVPSNSREFDGAKKVPNSRRHHDLVKNGSSKVVHPPSSTTVSSGPSSSSEANELTQNASDDETGAVTHRTLPGLIADIMSKGKRMAYDELCNAVLPHWPNLRKHNGERYAYSSHSQAVLDCLRNRSEWSRLVDRGPKTNGGRKRPRKSEADLADPESEDDDYSTDRNTKEVDNNEFPKGKRKARKHRRLALQGRGMKDVRRRRKAEVSDDTESSSDSSEESEFSDEEMQEGGPNEASASSDETETMS